MCSKSACSARVSFECPLLTESLFAPSRCYLSESCVCHNLNQHYPVLFATTNSCARPDTSTALSFHPIRLSLQVAVSPCCYQPFPNVNPQIFLHVQAPLPRLLLWCIYPFLPTRLRSSRRYDSVDARRLRVYSFTRTAISVRRSYRGCSNSLMFKPVNLLATLIAPTATYQLC